jgi:Flp pilus assembly pilin Flp
MTATIRRLLSNGAGAVSIEYAILATMLALVAVSGLTAIGAHLSGEFSQFSTIYK